MTDRACPPWCSSTHRDDVVVGYHSAHIVTLGHAAVSVAHFPREGDQVLVSGDARSVLGLPAYDARRLADLLSALPPEELPGLVAGLRAGADLVDPPAPEGGETP